MNILDSVREYYSIACSEGSRTITATRKQILQSLTGNSVRSAKQLNLLSSAIGARRSTVETEAKSRQILEEKKKIVPYLNLLARKSPVGSKIVSEEERMEVISFYESDHISDLLKGHNNVMKEVFISDSGEKIVFQRPKRVLKVNLCELLPLAQNDIGFKFSLRDHS